MSKTIQLVVFYLEKQCYALYLSAVDRIVQVVEITSLPKVPDIVLGVIDVEGEIIPVIDIRKRFRLPVREINLNDQLILANTSKRSLALVVDSVTDIIACPEEEVIKGKKILPGLEYVEGVVGLGNGLILIHNLDKFLSLEEENMITETMKEYKG